MHLFRIASCHAAGGAKDIVITVDGGKWYALKLQQFVEETVRQGMSSANVLNNPPPLPPVTGWKDFPAFAIPKTFSYGDIRQYVMNGPSLVSTSQNSAGSSDEDTNDFSTTKPLRRGRQYFLSGHVREIKQFSDKNTQFLKCLVMSSFKPDVQYHVHVSIDFRTGTIVDGSCECKSSAMGRCSHVCSLLLALDDYIIEFGYEPVAGTSKLCSWNRGRKTKKNPGIAHEKMYPKKKPKTTTGNLAPVIAHDPRPVENQTSEHSRLFINNFTATLYSTQNTSMWSTILQYQYDDYSLTADDMLIVQQRCDQFYDNLSSMISGSEPAQLEGTLGQSSDENWFRQRWFRITASNCKEVSMCKTEKQLSHFLIRVSGVMSPLKLLQ